MKKFTACVLAVLLTLTMLMTTAFAVDAGEERAVIAADLNEEQVAKIYEDFGIEQGSVKQITVTNADERECLEGLVDEKKIGYVALSCVYIKTLEEGAGTDISIMNINWCSAEMYSNALATAGITDADVRISAPKPVSGTAALTGIYLAYEDITGKKLNEDNKEAAAEELVITGSLAETIGSDEAAALVAELKKILDQTASMTDDEVREQIRLIAAELNIELTDEQVEQLLSLIRKLEKLDIAGLTETVNGVGEWFKNFFAGFGDFFKAIGDWLSSLFA